LEITKIILITIPSVLIGGSIIVNVIASLWGYRSKEKKILEKEAQVKAVAEAQISAAPWVAEMMADILHKEDSNIEDYLRHKPHPAQKAADTIAIIAKEKKILARDLFLLRYQLNAYESLFPWIEDYKEITGKELETIAPPSEIESDGEYETVANWLSPKEYRRLSTTEKYQLALDRYINSPNKSAWSAGIDFERYIGYLYEKQGYSVVYFGASAGLEDQGRDLIAKRRNKVLIIQCKRWREERTIHEKHIFQLFGTVTKYKLIEKSNDSEVVRGVFFTTTSLSELAKQCADTLRVEYHEKCQFNREYPQIKCNISKKTGEKIYHLPFDQQYDRVSIERERGEQYVQKVEEAEKLGFRRAHRYHFEEIKRGAP
jgi:hypothetical protein